MMSLIRWTLVLSLVLLSRDSGQGIPSTHRCDEECPVRVMNAEGMMPRLGFGDSGVVRVEVGL